MLIDDLIRLGRPLVEGGLRGKEMLELISDVGDDRVKNFYRHVFVVEIPPDGAAGTPVALPMQVWGGLSADGKNFTVDARRAVGAPFVLPSGGNPLNAQGKYGLPVFPVYDPHFAAFRESAAGVADYLEGRLERTSSLRLAGEMVEAVAVAVHAAAKAGYSAAEKWLGVLILAKCQPGSAYRYDDRFGVTDLGASLLSPGRFLVPDYERIVETAWEARIAEGAEFGRRRGRCSFTGREGEVVSAYSKAWPWAFPTWTCPLPHGGDEAKWIDGVALSADAYRALTAGARVFAKLTRRVHSEVLHELFAPTESRQARNIAHKRSISDLTPIYGAAYVLPLADVESTFDDKEFARSLIEMLDPPPEIGPQADRYLDAVTGFKSFLPEEVAADDFRLTLVYFSGDVNRGDVHLRAIIQEVPPGVLDRLQKLAKQAVDHADKLLHVLLSPSDKHVSYVRKCFRSVPYILARAFGGSHLWNLLEALLHRRTVDAPRFVQNCARRMASLTPAWPRSLGDLRDEVLFFLVARDFLDQCNKEAVPQAMENPMTMRPWRDLLHAIEKGPIEELEYKNVAELGFGCGALLRRYAGMYYMATKSGGEGKNFLKHRVLTFGADLTPDVVWKRGLREVCESAQKYRIDRQKSWPFLFPRIGATLWAFDSLADKVREQRDEFMTAFWSGYALQGYDRPKKTPGAGDAGPATTPKQGDDE